MNRQALAGPAVIVLVPVHGTWTSDWTRPGSAWRTFMARQGAAFPAEPFQWSGDVSGLPRLFSWWTTEKYSDWRAGAAALSWYLRGFPYEARNVVAHSHGGQLALFAAAQHYTWIRRLVTVATPCRGDLEGVTHLARPNIAHWTHVSSLDGDLMARLGQLFDGRIRRGRTQPLADLNVRHTKIGHSGMLQDPALFELWGGLLDTIRADDAAIGARHVRPLEREAETL